MKSSVTIRVDNKKTIKNLTNTWILLFATCLAFRYDHVS